MIILMALPLALLYILFTIWPLVEVIRLSLYKTNFMKTTFVGLGNYINVLADPEFLQSMLNSVFYAMLLVPGQIIVALMASLFLYTMNKKWQDYARIVFYIPVLSAGIIIANAWRWVFHMNGPINWLLNVFSIPSISWFSEWYTAIPIISFIVIFSTFGGNVIIFLSAILSIDKAIFDAAKIDGANDRQIKWKIVVPMIMPSIILIGLLSAINAFQVFETIFSLVPQIYASTMTYFIFQTSFVFSKFGAGAAEAVILLAVVLALSLIKKGVEK